jgi:drug/metabolite transporter (DMT)-like permease
MFVLFFVTAAFGATINQVQRTSWGYLLNIGYLVGSIWVRLFEGDQRSTGGAVFFRVPPDQQLPLWACWGALIALCLICLYMLARKIRGAEVVR